MNLLYQYYYTSIYINFITHIKETQLKNILNKKFFKTVNVNTQCVLERENIYILNIVKRNPLFLYEIE